MIYLNIKTSEGVETIDSLDPKDFNMELKRLKNEYRFCSEFYSGVYSSQRCAKA
jgi:hypothetical protein